MRKLLLITLLLIPLFGSACIPGAPSSKINLEMTDFTFTPSQFTIQAGDLTTLHVSHQGLVEHDFIIMKLNTEVGGHFNEEDRPNVYWEIDVQPGDSQTITFTAPGEPGTYQIVCGMAGHVEAGMIGTLEVVSQ